MKDNLTITVASGKGGTGKTLISTNLAVVLSENYYKGLSKTDNVNGGVQMIDCDVEEPNSHLFLKPDVYSREEVFITIPELDKEKCIQCGRCSDFCVYNALAFIGGEILVFPELCHGCGGCGFICPAHAIKEVKRTIGWIDQGKANQLDFLQGELKISTALAPPIIKKLKELVARDKVTIIDAPPGTSCSMVATLYKTDYVMLVTEPSPFGLHDLKLAYEVVAKMNIPCGVVINRVFGSIKGIEDFCAKEGIPILMKIPFIREYAQCYAQGNLLIEMFPDLKNDFLQLFHQVVEGIVS